MFTPEARSRFKSWVERYDARYGSAHSPMTYTLRAELPLDLDPALDLVVIEVDVMQHELYGSSGWQRALFLDREGAPHTRRICDLQRSGDGWTLHRYASGDLLRIDAATIITRDDTQLMLEPRLARFDRKGKQLWASERIGGALPNRARDDDGFELARPLPRTTRGPGIAAQSDLLVVVTGASPESGDGEIAMICSTSGDRTPRDSPRVGLPGPAREAGGGREAAETGRRPVGAGRIRPSQVTIDHKSITA